MVSSARGEDSNGVGSFSHLAVVLGLNGSGISPMQIFAAFEGDTAKGVDFISEYDLDMVSGRKNFQIDFRARLLLHRVAFASDDLICASHTALFV